MKRPLLAAATALTIAALLLGACGSSSNSAVPTTTAPSSSPTSSTTTTPSGGADPSTPDPTPADADMTALLVTVDDLPLGWVESDPSTDNPGDTDPSCITALDDLFRDSPSASTSFDSPFTGEYFYESAAKLGTNADAVFNQLVDGLDACTDVSFVHDGRTISGMIEPISFDEYGDDSAAWRMTFLADGGIVEYDLLAARYADVIMVFAFAGAWPIDEFTFTDLLLSAEDVLLAGIDPNADPGTEPDTGGGSGGGTGSGGGKIQTA